MLTDQQKTCVNLLLDNMPDPVKQSPVMLDMADDCMKHIMGGDPLESLRMKCALQLITKQAVSNNEKWINYLKNTTLDNFSNCLFNKYPEIMMSLFDHCPWAEEDTNRRVKISVKLSTMILEVNGSVFMNLGMNAENTSSLQWAPYILRRFFAEGNRRIDISFESDESPMCLETVDFYEEQLLGILNDTDYTSRGGYIYSNPTINWKYNLNQGSVAFAAHSKRRGGKTSFANLWRIPSDPITVEDALKTTKFPVPTMY